MRPIRPFTQIDLTYTVHVTHRLFHAENPLLYEVLTQGTTQAMQRVLVVMDKQVAGSRVGL